MLVNWILSWFGKHQTKKIRDGDIHRLSNRHYKNYLDYNKSLKELCTFKGDPIEDFSWDYIKQDCKEVLKEIDDEFVYALDKMSSGEIDDWHIPTKYYDGKYYNDCDGYAGLAALKLMNRGYSRKNLRIATCYARPGDFNSYHMVLLVDCIDQTRVFDVINKNDNYLWYEYGYKFDYMEQYPKGFCRIDTKT